MSKVPFRRQATDRHRTAGTPPAIALLPALTLWVLALLAPYGFDAGTRLLAADPGERSPAVPVSEKTDKAGEKVPDKPSDKGADKTADKSKPSEGGKDDKGSAKQTDERENGAKEGKDKEAKPPVGSLTLTVKLALMADPRLFPYEIDVTLDKDHAILKGAVSTEAEKASAEAVTRGVPGVAGVTNKIDIAADMDRTASRRRDELITRYIKERFEKSMTLKAAKFDVTTENGIVSLSGSIRFQVIALEAAEAARQIPGVRAVKTDNVRLEAEK